MSGADLAIIGALLVGASGLVTAIATYKQAATKAQMDLVTSTMAILKSENDRLSVKLQHLEDEIEERDGSYAKLKEWAELLVAQVRSLGGIPIPFPEREKTKPRTKGAK